MSGFNFRMRGNFQIPIHIPGLNLDIFGHGRFGGGNRFQDCHHHEYNRFSNRHNNLAVFFHINPHRYRQEEEQLRQDPQTRAQAETQNQTQPQPQPRMQTGPSKEEKHELAYYEKMLIDGNELNDRSALMKIGDELKSHGVDVIAIKAITQKIRADENQGKYVGSSQAAELILALEKAKKTDRWNSKELTAKFAAAAELRDDKDDISNSRAIEEARKLIASDSKNSVPATEAGAPPATNKMAAK
jgi:hypothetical protein